MIKLDFLGNRKATEDKSRIRIRNPVVQIRICTKTLPRSGTLLKKYKKLNTDTIQAEEEANYL
jgi:hypothetical protein